MANLFTLKLWLTGKVRNSDRVIHSSFSWPNGVHRDRVVAEINKFAIAFDVTAVEAQPWGSSFTYDLMTFMANNLASSEA